MEITEAAKDGQMPTHEECYWAMLALDALHCFEHMDLMRLAAEPPNLFNNPKRRYEEAFKRAKRALSADPKTWMGPDNDPSNPARQQERAMCKRIADGVLGKS